MRLLAASLALTTLLPANPTFAEEVTPANVTVITAREIEDNHYQSVNEALSHVNGLFTGNAIQMNGGNSVLYGSDAFSGVANIVTKKGTRNETTIDLNTSTYDHHRGQHQYELTNQGITGKFGRFLTGRLYKTHPPEFKSGLATDIWEFNFTEETDKHNFSARADYRFTDRDSLTFDAMHISNQHVYARLAPLC